MKLESIETITDPAAAEQFATDVEAFAKAARAYAIYQRTRAFQKPSTDVETAWREARLEAPAVLSVADATEKARQAHEARVRWLREEAKAYAERSKTKDQVEAEQAERAAREKASEEAAREAALVAKAAAVVAAGR